MSSRRLLLTVFAPVGEVWLADDDSLHIDLAKKWAHIARDITADVLAGKRLIGDDLVSRKIVPGALDDDQLRTLSQVITNRSEGELLAFPALDETGDHAA